MTIRLLLLPLVLEICQKLLVVQSSDRVRVQQRNSVEATCVSESQRYMLTQSVASRITYARGRKKDINIHIYIHTRKCIHVFTAAPPPCAIGVGLALRTSVLNFVFGGGNKSNL